MAATTEDNNDGFLEKLSTIIENKLPKTWSERLNISSHLATAGGVAYNIVQADKFTVFSDALRTLQDNTCRMNKADAQSWCGSVNHSYFRKNEVKIIQTVQGKNPKGRAALCTEFQKQLQSQADTVLWSGTVVSFLVVVAEASVLWYTYNRIKEAKNLLPRYRTEREAIKKALDDLLPALTEMEDAVTKVKENPEGAAELVKIHLFEVSQKLTVIHSRIRELKFEIQGKEERIAADSGNARKTACTAAVQVSGMVVNQVALASIASPVALGFSIFAAALMAITATAAVVVHEMSEAVLIELREELKHVLELEKYANELQTQIDAASKFLKEHTKQKYGL